MSSFKIVLFVTMVSSTIAVPVATSMSALTDRSSNSASKALSSSSSSSPLEANKNWEEPTVPRDYMFNYDIQDGLVGMTHSRGEVQKNGVIRGFYRYNRPDGVLVSVTYTADETGFHPVISEEAVPNLRSASSVHSMYSSDHPEQIKITITQDDVQLARQKSEAYAAAIRAAPDSVSSSTITGLKQQFMNPMPAKMRSVQQIFADSFESEQLAAESQDSEHVIYSSIPDLARYPKTVALGRVDAAKRYYDLA